MDELTIFPSKLSGRIAIPPSKSHTQRALLFSMLGSATSRIINPLLSPDTEAMLTAIALFGAKIERKPNLLEIQGGFSLPEDIIDAGNSGQVLRFMGALSALLPGGCEITGDASIRTRRPIKALLYALRHLGAIAESARGDGHAPILINGPIHPGACRLSGEDSQPVSALLMATSFLDGPSEIFVDNPGETPWIDLTLDWLKRLGGVVENDNYTHYRVKGGLNYSGINYTVPGDFSTAAFPLVAALITQSTLSLEGLDPNDVQGDKILIEILQKMGAKIQWKDNELIVFPSQLIGQKIDINSCIDALPILAVAACFAKGRTLLYNGAIAREKESDRIASIAKELKKMGANIEEREDGLVIEESTLQGASLDGHSDHRIALATAVAALGAKGSSHIQSTTCINKTYPTFIKDFQTCGAVIELDLVRV